MSCGIHTAIYDIWLPKGQSLSASHKSLLDCLLNWCEQLSMADLLPVSQRRCCFSPEGSPPLPPCNFPNDWASSSLPRLCWYKGFSTFEWGSEHLLAVSGQRRSINASPLRAHYHTLSVRNISISQSVRLQPAWTTAIPSMWRNSCWTVTRQMAPERCKLTNRFNKWFAVLDKVWRFTNRNVCHFPAHEPQTGSICGLWINARSNFEVFCLATVVPTPVLGYMQL